MGESKSVRKCVRESDCESLFPSGVSDLFMSSFGRVGDPGWGRIKSEGDKFPLQIFVGGVVAISSSRLI